NPLPRARVHVPGARVRVESNSDAWVRHDARGSRGAAGTGDAVREEQAGPAPARRTGPDVSAEDQPSDTVFSAMNCDARGWRPETFSLTTQTTLMYAIETVGRVSAMLSS